MSKKLLHWKTFALIWIVAVTCILTAPSLSMAAVSADEVSAVAIIGAEETTLSQAEIVVAMLTPSTHAADPVQITDQPSIAAAPVAKTVAEKMATTTVSTHLTQ